MYQTDTDYKFSTSVYGYSDYSSSLKQPNFCGSFLDCSLLTTSFKQTFWFGGDEVHTSSGNTTTPARLFAKKSSDGKTISWYDSSDMDEQYNRSTFTYYWLGIG